MSSSGVANACDETKMQDCHEQMSALDELPTHASIVARFGLYEIDGLCNPQVNADGTVWCSCLHCHCWHSYVEGRLPEGTHVQYEVFTREFVHGLAAYLRERAAVYRLPRVKVLEVGAGDGRLSHYLRLLLEPMPGEASKEPVFEIVATDSGQRGLASGQPYGHEVHEQDAVEALAAEQPHIVIACWQPLGVDWTAEIRRTDSVLEYLLIGEKDGGICGHPWLTWGVKADDYCQQSWTAMTTFGRNRLGY
ncbi:hypothetical protein KFL_003940010 [Klebsormidium nitens]|uniref:Uncharacterized protein n=1 Tax=Klebsormidium nitens TaxID=105231 RepID=A0A1Y1IAR4_KLENI|nr:hypothetical protein KFL_003940010 [Klebsormidium nitens]|eukprot:GAQ88010.1 hypothetical protein KFL_003940010 [Klebsormidium nitens]